MDKLRLPPGFLRNGTVYSAVGRWVNGNLVRWVNNVLRPIAGWQRRHDFAANAVMGPLWSASSVEAVRSGVLAVDALAGANLYLGSNKEIYSVSSSNSKDIVTPSGFPAQPIGNTGTTGYGTYRYGYGLYGTPRPLVGAAVPYAFTWGFSTWGFWPIAVARGVSPLHIYIKKDTDVRFVPITASPVGSFDALVTDERFLMSFGKVSAFRLVEWSNRENYDVWAPTISNQAGSFNLVGEGRLVRGVKVGSRLLILSETDAFSARYVGPPYVYGFPRVGDDCGIIGPNAIAVAADFAIWLGDKSFWKFDGTVTEVDCEVMDFYQSDHNRNHRSKTCAFVISDLNEMWWLYQSNDSIEDVDNYIVYNWKLQRWYTGKIRRTFGLGSKSLSYPVMVSLSGRVYDHEVPGSQRGEEVAFIESGPLETSNGKILTAVAYVLPDIHAPGTVTMTLACRDDPELPPRYEQAFTLAYPTPTTGIMGRDIRMTLTGDRTNPNWAIGDMRIEYPGAMQVKR